jgi:hypothetical protein
MIEVLFWLLVGAFIGWHFPQPAWAKVLEDKVKGFFTSKGE